MLESVFNKVPGPQACNFLKKRLQHRCLLVKFLKFLRTPNLKNIFKGLLLKGWAHTYISSYEIYYSMKNICMHVNCILLVILCCVSLTFNRHAEDLNLHQVSINLQTKRPIKWSNHPKWSYRLSQKSNRWTLKRKLAKVTTFGCYFSFFIIKQIDIYPKFQKFRRKPKLMYVHSRGWHHLDNV